MVWGGRDQEDGEKILYCYRVDAGRWSAPSEKTSMGLADLNLGKGEHFFELKAIDREGLESEVKSYKIKK